MYQNGINADAYHDQERLESKGKQGSQVVISHLSPFPVDHGGHGDRRDRRDHVDLNHAAIHDDEDADAEYPGDDPHEGGLEPESEKRPDIHLIEPGFHVGYDGRYIQRGITDDDACGLADNMLGYVKDCHNDIPGVCYDEHCRKGFENPLEEDEGFKIVHVVPVNDQLNELQTHDEGQDDAGNRHYDIFRQVPDHIEDASVPCLRRFAYSSGYIRDAGIDAVKQPGKIADDSADQQPFQPFCDFVPYEVQKGIPPKRPPPVLPGEGGSVVGAVISRRGR